MECPNRRHPGSHSLSTKLKMKLQLLYLLIITLASYLLVGCQNNVPMVNLGIDDYYYVNRMQKLLLHSALAGERYQWSVLDKNGSWTPVASGRDYLFISSQEGEYKIRFEIIDDATPYSYEFIVRVLHEEIEYSPYISKVYEYCPAPGQFINEMPKYEPGDTYADILKKAEDCIMGTNDIMISLGGYGGYVTFGFDHTVMNVAGENDFRIWGNAFYELTDPEAKGGSAEPGIVMVSLDTNCNGLPDDEWYELAGSEYYSPATRHNYSITYHKPDKGKDQVPDESGYLTDITYIPWEDSMGEFGYIAKNSFHSQDYFPLWETSDKLSFSGTLLAPNAKDLSGNGTYYVLYSYPWGYADNHPNDYADLNSFDIGRAVDKNGKTVNLPGADFVRVYTGVNQYCGWMGESSTEISKAEDLHISISM